MAAVTGCAREGNSDSSATPYPYDDGQTYGFPTGTDTDTTTGGGTSTGDTSSGVPTSTDPTDPTSPSACPSGMTHVSVSSGPYASTFCMDSAQPGASNLYGADAACNLQGKHVCTNIELSAACEKGTLNAAFYGPYGGIWTKRSPVPVSSSDKTGDYMSGTTCSQYGVTNHADTNWRAYYCCK